jgi:pimeloyl-ACP methyl ester carboxylesterase
MCLIGTEVMANGESMKRFNLFAAGLTLVISAYGQTSQVVPWQPSTDDVKKSVYHPEPMLFIHGINDNDATWGEVAIPSLKTVFSQYDLPVTASNNFIGARTNLNARQEAYLHTFNYGNYVKATMPANAQAFDHIEWNTWEADMRETAFTNIYWRPTNTNRQSVFQTPPDPTFLQAAPNDNRMTLEARINGRAGNFQGIRDAYRADPNDPTNKPKIVLVAHSMGGLLSHYYLCKCTEASIDSGVRRLVTLGSPHQGSGFANWVLWDHSCGIFTRIFDTVSHHPVGSVLSYAGRPSQAGGAALTYGYYAYPGNGALEDISRNLPNESSKLHHHNELMDFFWNNPVPTIEYVFNVYAAGVTSIKYKWVVELSVEDQGLTDEQRYGDGVVAQRSAAGKLAQMELSIFSEQDPVIFGTWQHTDHSHETSHMQSIFQSLFGVPYQWPDSSSTVPLRRYLLRLLLGPRPITRISPLARVLLSLMGMEHIPMSRASVR